jgi:transcription elongation factor Elf1
MIDISKQKIDAPCPTCGHKNSITLAQVNREETITCRCGQRIQLTDSGGSSKKATQDINRAMKDFERALKGFGR